ncbi:hypothetical protein F5Y14DRAFT_94838 [Nemania sp. NC0429]|nr:hypothetical protein F5Y14DRAFT_94838 [Nemania sp. NC0429]
MAATNSDSLLAKTVIAIAQQLGHVGVAYNEQCGLCNSDVQASRVEAKVSRSSACLMAAA